MMTKYPANATAVIATVFIRSARDFERLQPPEAGLPFGLIAGSAPRD